MRVFISYSTDDLDLVKKFADYLGKHADVKYWDRDKIPGADAWPTIFQWIDTAHLVLVLVTGSTVGRAMPVGQEVGRAKAKEKQIFPIVSLDVPASELGFLSGITFERIDPENPGPTLQRVSEAVRSLAEKSDSIDALWAVAGLVGLMWLIGSSKK